MDGLLSSLSAQVIAGFVLLGLAVAVRLITRNRVIRSRVRLDIILALVFIGVNAALAAPGLIRPETRPLAISVGQLVIAFAVIHFLLLVLVNPLRADRVPERFPTIVQDVTVFVLFAMVATLVLEEKFVTTSAVGALVAGLALQDTLGNLVSGLAIQVEKPFRLGHWIQLGEWEGAVSEITWRAVKVRTRDGNELIIPNSELAKSTLVNYSEPGDPTRVHVEVGTSYQDAPNAVKAAILDTLERESMVLSTPRPDVRLVEFADSSIKYRADFWIERFPLEEIVKDRVLTALFYTFNRRGISIPFPIQVQYTAELPSLTPTPEKREQWERLLAATNLFGALEADDLRRLATESPLRMFGAGETVFRQGDQGQSAFVVGEGRVRVVLEPAGTELAVLGRGDYFGEMSLLAGEPRTATINAVDDCEVLEVTADRFRQFVIENPAILERIGAVVAERRAGLARARSSTVDVPLESAHNLVARVRRFFGI